MMCLMAKTLSSQATDWREGRRLRVFELKEQGWKQKEIAEALGVSEGAVSQWMRLDKDRRVPQRGASMRPSSQHNIASDHESRRGSPRRWL
jgi:transposase